jgi:co-chaperonin GroES (HSP10)
MATATIPAKRRLIPKEYTVKFKQLFSGLEVHAVLGERVLVDEIEPYTEADAAAQRSNIVAPQVYYDSNGQKRNTEKPRACTGIVISLGEGITDAMRAAGLVENAAVCFGSYAGTEYYIGGAKFRILDVKEILAVLRATEGNDLDEVIGPVKA